jgi:electron transport complex protein RnfD
MTTWMPAFQPDRFTHVPGATITFPFAEPIYDGVSGATPLALWKFQGEMTAVGKLLTGWVSGSAGETSAILILLGGIYLIVRNMMNWRIPVAILGTVAAFSGILHLVDPSYPTPLFMLFSGGLMLGAMFMATDMVGSPMTGRGCILYGVVIGSMVVVIRVWGGMPEGVMYAILLGNAISPLLDRVFQPRVYGAVPRKARA